MADPLAIITNAVKALQKLREVTQKVKDADTLNIIADLQLSLADLKSQILDLQEENSKLKAAAKASSDVDSLRSNLELRKGVYFFRTPVAGRANGPYCSRCLDVDRLLVIVKEEDAIFHNMAKYTCPQCKAHF